jgi:poly(ADP-ribose) glycohydrolase
VISPELLVSLLFTAKLEDNEVIEIWGSEKFSTYSGYSYTFQWKNPYIDETPALEKEKIFSLQPQNSHKNGENKSNILWASGKIKDCVVIAMDALYFGNFPEMQITQWKKSKIDRELQKSLLGFTQNNKVQNKIVATGNWGCGAFGG